MTCKHRYAEDSVCYTNARLVYVVLQISRIQYASLREKYAVASTNVQTHVFRCSAFQRPALDALVTLQPGFVPWPDRIYST